MILVETGRLLADPANLFVRHVMTKIDFSYACAGAWDPVYRISFAVIWLGYASSLAFGLLLVRQVFLRRRYLRIV